MRKKHNRRKRKRGREKGRTRATACLESLFASAILSSTFSSVNPEYLSPDTRQMNREISWKWKFLRERMDKTQGISLLLKKSDQKHKL
jgi:hypothetical protein